MNDKDKDSNSKQLYTISWTQNYDAISLPELMDELALEPSGLEEANQVINQIKSKL